ncbi:hypothetical protein WMY93_002224 [Mugilogobius chulae]|uniref:Uncharacterized protein n=1 Tax=Mugilogobius chulae TaxID=88201 RepID=A0AAW0PSY9_9GOBI
MSHRVDATNKSPSLLHLSLSSAERREEADVPSTPLFTSVKSSLSKCGAVSQSLFTPPQFGASVPSQPLIGSHTAPDLIGSHTTQPLIGSLTVKPLPLFSHSFLQLILEFKAHTLFHSTKSFRFCFYNFCSGKRNLPYKGPKSTVQTPATAPSPALVKSYTRFQLCHAKRIIRNHPNAPNMAPVNSNANRNVAGSGSSSAPRANAVNYVTLQKDKKCLVAKSNIYLDIKKLKTVMMGLDDHINQLMSQNRQTKAELAQAKSMQSQFAANISELYSQQRIVNDHLDKKCSEVKSQILARIDQTNFTSADFVWDLTRELEPLKPLEELERDWLDTSRKQNSEDSHENLEQVCVEFLHKWSCCPFFPAAENETEANVSASTSEPNNPSTSSDKSEVDSQMRMEEIVKAAENETVKLTPANGDEAENCECSAADEAMAFDFD